MKKETLILISILLILLSFWLGMKVEKEIASWDLIGKPIFEKKQIHFPNKKTALYLKSKNWGLTYDHKVTVISTKPSLEFQPDSLTEFIFQGFNEIIYKVKNDTLEIYSQQKPKIPLKFESKIRVKLIEVKNNSEWIKMNKHINSNFQKFE